MKNKYGEQSVSAEQMKALILSIEVISKYNTQPLEDSIREFEEYTGQKVPQKAIDEFKFIGLNNVDFFKSNYLNQYGLKSILQLSPITHMPKSQRIKTAEQILEEIANREAHRTWGELMYNSGSEDNVEYAKEAMKSFSEQSIFIQSDEQDIKQAFMSFATDSRKNGKWPLLNSDFFRAGVKWLEQNLRRF